MKVNTNGMNNELCDEAAKSEFEEEGLLDSELTQLHTLSDDTVSFLNSLQHSPIQQVTTLFFLHLVLLILSKTREVDMKK